MSTPVLERINRLGEEHVIENPDFTNGLWFASTNALYIVPKDNPDKGIFYDDVIGPDDEVTDRIIALCREGIDEFKFAEILKDEYDLLPVASVLRRWEPTMGYYHA